jgi:YHS domain-containing protein
VIAILALLLATAQTPEECLVVKGKAAATATHDGKTYRFASVACRDEFLTDPERFSQLYDALLELRGQGIETEKRPESLVPS